MSHVSNNSITIPVDFSNEDDVQTDSYTNPGALSFEDILTMYHFNDANNVSSYSKHILYNMLFFFLFYSRNFFFSQQVREIPQLVIHRYQQINNRHCPYSSSNIISNSNLIINIISSNKINQSLNVQIVIQPPLRYGEEIPKVSHYVMRVVCS